MLNKRGNWANTVNRKLPTGSKQSYKDTLDLCDYKYSLFYIIVFNVVLK